MGKPQLVKHVRFSSIRHTAPVAWLSRGTAVTKRTQTARERRNYEYDHQYGLSRTGPHAAYLSRLANQLTTTVIDDREVASAGMVLMRKRPSGATSKGMKPVTRVLKSGMGTPGLNAGPVIGTAIICPSVAM